MASVKPTCDEPMCEKPSRALKLCPAHYNKRRRALRGAKSRTLGDDPKVRIAARCSKSPSGCWLWTGTINREGYGVLEFQRKRHLAHRISYEAHVGPIPPGLTIDHLCRVTSCVNPDHLEPVTNAENIRRAVQARAGGARTPFSRGLADCKESTDD